MRQVLYHLCEALRVSGILLNAYLPSTAPKMMDQLGLDASALDLSKTCLLYTSCILPVVFKVSTKICLFLCIVCEWTNDAPACIIKPETREVQQKLK